MFQTDKSRILKLNMSSVVIEPSYMPVERPATQAHDSSTSREKLALAIPTLREAGNIRKVLDHVRSVLDPVGRGGFREQCSMDGKTPMQPSWE